MAGSVDASYTKPGMVNSLVYSITNLADRLVLCFYHIEIGPVGGDAFW